MIIGLFFKQRLWLSLHLALYLFDLMSTNVSTAETTPNTLNIMSDKSLVDALHAFLSEYQLAFIVAVSCFVLVDPPPVIFLFDLV